MFILSHQELPAFQVHPELTQQFEYRELTFEVTQLFDLYQEVQAVQACKQLLESEQCGLVIAFDQVIALCLCIGKARQVSTASVNAFSAVGMTSPSVQEDPQVDELLDALNAIYELSGEYLGKTLATKYLEKSRPSSHWTENFQITESEVQFIGSPKDIGSSELHVYSQWMKTFISSCSHIIRDFPKLVERRQIRVCY